MDTPANPEPVTRRRWKWLRIAVSAICLTICAFLLTMWLRSYLIWDSVVWGVTEKKGIDFRAQQGEIYIRFMDHSSDAAFQFIKWRHDIHLPKTTKMLIPAETLERGVGGFHFKQFRPGNFSCGFPYWCPVLLFAALAYVPWLPWSFRYRLRTLFIVMTVVAILLGLGVWLTRG